MRPLAALVLIGCGSSAPLTGAAPPPVWPVENITVHPEVAATAAPRTTLLFDAPPTAVSVRCGDSELPARLDGSIVQVDGALAGCQLAASRDGAPIAFEIGVGDSPLACTWEPARCGLPIPPAPPPAPQELDADVEPEVTLVTPPAPPAPVPKDANEQGSP